MQGLQCYRNNVDFIVTVMERFYYRNRLERFANGRVTMYHLLLEKLSARSSYIKGQQDIQVLTSSTGTSFLVPSEEDREVLYEVGAAVGVCTCPAGMCLALGECVLGREFYASRTAVGTALAFNCVPEPDQLQSVNTD